MQGVREGIIKYLDEDLSNEFIDLVTTASIVFKERKSKGDKSIKSFLDVFTDAEYARYNELIFLSQENKANCPRRKKSTQRNILL